MTVKVHLFPLHFVSLNHGCSSSNMCFPSYTFPEQEGVNSDKCRRLFLRNCKWENVKVVSLSIRVELISHPFVTFFYFYDWRLNKKRSVWLMSTNGGCLQEGKRSGSNDHHGTKKVSVIRSALSSATKRWTHNFLRENTKFGNIYMNLENSKEISKTALSKRTIFYSRDGQ